jgi:hypothetical protein
VRNNGEVAAELGEEHATSTEGDSPAQGQAARDSRAGAGNVGSGGELDCWPVTHGTASTSTEKGKAQGRAWPAEGHAAKEAEGRGRGWRNSGREACARHKSRERTVAMASKELRPGRAP